jgi:hypothetical protein
MKRNANFKNHSCLKAVLVAGGCGIFLGLPAHGWAAPSHAIVHQFNVDDGAWPAGNMTLVSNTLYGSMMAGTNRGGIYQINTDGTGFVFIKGFTGLDAHHETPGMALSDGYCYGALAEGPTIPGSVFRVRTDGSGYSVLKYFNNSGVEGVWPEGNLVILSNKLYGTAPSSWGGFSAGTLFTMNTDGSGFALLRQFQGGTDGNFPQGGLALSAATLYGITTGQNPGSTGTVFSITTDGSVYKVLKRFKGTDGAMPQAGLALSGTTLYGTTAYGGIGYN